MKRKDTTNETRLAIEFAKHKDDFILKLNSGNTIGARDYIQTFYKMAIIDVDSQLVNRRLSQDLSNINLNELSSFLYSLYDELKTNEEKKCFISSMKEVINVKSCHRKICIDAVSNILKSIQSNKRNSEINKNCKISEIDTDNKLLNRVNELYNPNPKFDHNTTIEGIYNHIISSSKRNHSSKISKLISSITDRFSKSPTDQDYQKLVRYIINSDALKSLSDNIKDNINNQRQNSLKLPDSYTANIVCKDVIESNKYTITKFANNVGHLFKRIIGEDSDPRKELINNFNTNLASMIISLDTQMSPLEMKHLESIDNIMLKAQKMREGRSGSETIYDLVDCIFEEVSHILTEIFGKEISKIVDGVKDEFRAEIRTNLKKNLSDNFDKSIEKLGKIFELIKESSVSMIDSISPTNSPTNSPNSFQI